MGTRVPVSNGRHKVRDLHRAVTDMLLRGSAPLPIVSSVVNRLSAGSATICLGMSVTRLTRYPLSFRRIVHLN